MRYLFFLILLGLNLTSCRRDLIYIYQLENIGTKDIVISSIDQFSEVDLAIKVDTIEPGVRVNIEYFYLKGITKDFEDDPIYIQFLRVINDDGIEYNKDVYNNAMWEKEEVDGSYFYIY